MPFPLPSVPVPDPPLTDGQMNYGGLTFGGFSGQYQLVSVTGLGQDGIRTGDIARPRDQGAYAGINLLGERTITAQLGVTADTTSLTHSRRALEKAFNPAVVQESPFYLQVPGSPLLVCMARCTKYDPGPLDALFFKGLQAGTPAAAPGMALVTAQFMATDPRWYTAPTTSSGPVAPGSSINLANPGTYEMRPLLVVQGPCTGLTIENTTLNAALSFRNPGSSIDLDVGDTLTIDLDFGSVTWFDFDTDTYSTVPNWLVTGSVWWNLPAGVTSNIAFTAVSHSSPAGLTVQWAPAWYSA